MRTNKIIIVLAVLMLASCSGNNNDIEDAAYHYLDAMGNYDFDAAWSYATPETQQSTLTIYKEKIMPHTDMNYVRSNMPAHITITSVEQQDDTSATVAFHKSTPIQEQDGSVEMRFRDGEWKAHVVIQLPPELEGEQTHEYKYNERETINLTVSPRSKPQR